MTDTVSVLTDVSAPALVFEEAEYVKPEGTGRKADPNPFLDVVADIALKTDPKTGKPVARATVIEHVEGDRDKAVGRIKRRLSEAGAQNDPPVSVPAVARPVVNPVNKKESATKTRITFWTTKRQERPRKSETTDGSPSAERSV